MARILTIETATRNCSVALSHNGKTIAFREVAEQGYSHAEKLHVFIDEILKEANISYNELNAVAVSKGPGSYTGLRIGVSAAKGLCFALGVPLISIDTLKILASQAGAGSDYIVPMIDARRMEAYTAIYDRNLKLVREVKAEILSGESFRDLEGEVLFAGDCLQKAKTVLASSNFNFADDVIFPSARTMSAISHEKFENGDFEDVAYFEPFYLKDFMAGPSK